MTTLAGSCHETLRSRVRHSQGSNTLTDKNDVPQSTLQNEFSLLLQGISWNDRRWMETLEADQHDFDAWKSGIRPPPDRIMRIVRKYYDIYNPGKRASLQPPQASNPGFADGVRPLSSVRSPGPAGANEVSRLKDKIHELEEQLHNLRKSYRELSGENEKIRRELAIVRGEQSEAFGPYEVLGVKPGDDWATIKRAYIQLSKDYHPDRGGDVHKMQAVSEAFSELRLVYGF